MLSPEADLFDFPDDETPELQEPLKERLRIIQENGLDETLVAAWVYVDEVEDDPAAAPSTKRRVNTKSKPPSRSKGVPTAHKLYSQRLDEYPELGPTEEEALLMQLADAKTREKARQQLLARNQKLVVTVSKDYQAPGLERMDFIQSGMIGLDKATADFNVFRSRRFGAYARYPIRNAMLDAISKATELPEKTLKAVTEYLNTADKLHRESGREPTATETAAEMGIPVEKLAELHRRVQGKVYLDAPIPNGEISLIDLVPDQNAPPVKQVEDKELYDTIRRLLDEYLDEREAAIIRGSFGMNDEEIIFSQQELGDQFGITSKRVQQIKAKALEKLKQPIAEHRSGAEVPEV